MEVILFAIVSIIVAIISAASKNKPKKQEGDQPPKRPVSDIQRALSLLLDDFDSDKAPSQDYSYGRAQQAPPQPTEAFTETPAFHGEQTGFAPAPQMQTVSQAAPANKYANVTLDRYFMDEPDNHVPPKAGKSADTKGGLLSFGKDELVRAVIFSEILARRR